MQDIGQFSTAARLLVVAASFVVVVAGMRAASDILTPLLLAIFVALLCLPAVRWLNRKRVPDGVAVPAVLVLTLLVLFALLSVLTTSMTEFASDVPEFKRNYVRTRDKAVQWVQETFNVDLNDPAQIPLAPDAEVEEPEPETEPKAEGESSRIFDSLDASKILEFVGNVLGQFSSLLSNLLLIILLVVFLLFELLALPRKLALAQPDRESRGEFERIVKSVNKYITIKTMASVLTGVLSGVLCAVVGVRYPVLWGMTAFMLNYIPNIGSILAAVPPVLLAIILPDLGFGEALVVAGGYVAINMIIGNVIEPRMMGRSLDLSTLVVFVSMVFWGWVFGAIGMFLSVPLTMVLKIALEGSETTKPLAILLGTAPEPDSAPE